MPTYLLEMAYEGTSYFGWQRTASGPSVQQAVEEALAQLLQERVALEGASRTDRGVHASGQIAHFVTTRTGIHLGKLQTGLNALLPPSIRIWKAIEAPTGFHATLSATGKEYHYYLCNEMTQLPIHRYTSWHIPYALNAEAMLEAARYLIGTHDFTSLCNWRRNLNYTSYERTLTRVDLVPLAGGRWRIEVVGRDFLYKMVRNCAGMLTFAGRGKIVPKDIPNILAGRSRPLAGPTAPAHGLFLHKVYYDWSE